MNRRTVLMLPVIIMILLGLLTTGGCDEMENNIEGLLIPNESESRAMIAEYTDVNGAKKMVQPSSYNIRLAVEKGLSKSSGFDSKYLSMQALYRKAFELFLSERLELAMYDDVLANSELRFIPIENDRMSFYQKYSTFGFRYIYLRDNIPIERLSEADLNILGASISANNTGITDELLELVARTYNSVIIAYDDWEDDTIIGYSNNGQKRAPNNALVFEIGHTIEFDEEGDFVDTANEMEKNNYLKNEFIPLMEEKLSEALGWKVIVFINWD